MLTPYTGMNAMALTLKAREVDAASTLPSRETKTVSSEKAAASIKSGSAPGAPNHSSRQKSPPSKRLPSSRPNSSRSAGRCMSSQKTAAENHWAATVAQAAPAMPISRKPNLPKIRR